MSLEALVLDFDGVIADTPAYYAKYMVKYFEELGVDLSEEDVSHLVGYTFSKKLGYINEKYGLNVGRKEFVEKTSGQMNAEMHHSIVCAPSLRQLLKQLKGEGIPVGIASSNSLRNIDFYIAKFGIKNFFSGIVALENVENAKPAPDCYVGIASLLGVKPANCVAVEDTSIGVESAVSAGLKCIALPNKFTLNHDFSKSHFIAKDFSEITLEKIRSLV